MTIGLSLGSAESFATALGSAQFSDASCCRSCGVTHARSLAFLGLAPVAAGAEGAPFDAVQHHVDHRGGDRRRCHGFRCHEHWLATFSEFALARITAR